MREREAKLLVDVAFRVPELDVVADGVLVGREDHVDLDATYFDTSDLRLTRFGASLRYRSNDGWTLKLPESADASSLTRIEHVFAGDPGAPPEAALDLVRAWIRTAPVLVVAHVRTRRHRIVLTDAHGARLAEIDDDRVTTHAPAHPRCDFREVEIELDEQAPARLAKRLRKFIEHAGPTRTSTVPKIARALGVDDLAPIGAGDAVSLRKRASVIEFVQALLGESVQRLLEHDLVIRIGEDPEGVHQARVATRRLRSDLRTFRKLLDPEWCEALRDELRRLGTALGAVRDADVLGDFLRAHGSTVPASHRPAFDALLAELDAQRTRQRDELLGVLRSHRYAGLLDRLVDAAHAPAVRVDVASLRARPRAYEQVRRPWRRLRKAVGKLGDPPTDAALHEVRRRAKQARYAAEALALVEPRWPESAAADAEAVQQVLGDYQDRVVARAWLEQAARDRPELAFVAGEVAGRVAAEQDELRTRARAAWKAAGKQRVG